MIECTECGCPYEDSLPCCPECGNPTEYSSNKTSMTNCPNCGAPIINSISCEYCGTVFPKPVIQNRNQNDNSIDTGVAAFLGGVVGGLIR
jgi:ribosomal protein L32